MNDILRDLRHEVEAAVAERDRLWEASFEEFNKEDMDVTEFYRLHGLYCDASRKEIKARAELHKAIMAAVKEEGDGRAIDRRTTKELAQGAYWHDRAVCAPDAGL